MNNWRETTLGEVCLVIGGGTPSKKNKAFYGGGIPWATVRDMNCEVISTTDHTITKKAIASSSTNIIPAGNVVIATRVGLGKVCLLQQDTAINQDLRGIVPKDSENITPRFLFYWYKVTASRVIDAGTGATVQGVKVEFIKSLRLLLPPLGEQKRIVAILDEAFAAIDAATANAEKNLANAREVFESYINAVFERKGAGWRELPLISLCDLFVDSAHRTPKYQDEGIPALRPRDVVNGVLSLSSARRVSNDEYKIQSKRHKPCPEDIVYSRELSYGWAAILPDSPRVCLSQGMCLFRPSDEIEPELLLYILNGPIGREQAAIAAVGTAHPHINLGDIKAYRIPVPPHDRQSALIEQLDHIATKTQQLASLYTRKLALLAELKQSILQKAFSGELTAGDDESATRLEEASV